MLFVNISLSMFKFNFNNDDDSPEAEGVSKCDVGWYKSSEIKIPNNIMEVVNSMPKDHIIKVDYGNGLTYTCPSPKSVMKSLRENNGELSDALRADELHSDLLPGIYEGGLKTWECTRDLVPYFLKNEIKKIRDTLKGKRILDLGCGSGLLGITCLMYGAEVMFQDYNQEVLENMTIPNIFLNCDESVRDRVKLYNGDWYLFLNKILKDYGKCGELDEEDKFDYILTSETIYNPANYSKIISIFEKLLKPNGSAFVAAKLHYFGVGGSLKEFENILLNDGFDCVICWRSKLGVAREILKVQL